MAVVGNIAFRGALRATVLGGRRLWCCVGRAVLTGCTSERQWKTSDSKARATLRGLAMLLVSRRCLAGAGAGAGAGDISALNVERTSCRCRSRLLHPEGGYESD